MKQGWQFKPVPPSDMYLFLSPSGPRTSFGVHVNIAITLGFLVAQAKCALPESGDKTKSALEKTSASSNIFVFPKIEI